jgi:hypothetical protein
MFQLQHRHFGRPHPRAAGGQAVFVQVVFQRRDRPGQRGDDRELVRDHRGKVIGRLADADHRAVGQAAGGIQPGVVETGDDHGIGVDTFWTTVSTPGTLIASS